MPKKKDTKGKAPKKVKNKAPAKGAAVQPAVSVGARPSLCGDEQLMSQVFTLIEAQSRVISMLMHSGSASSPSLAARGLRQVDGGGEFEETVWQLSQALIDEGARLPFTRHDNALGLIGNEAVLVQNVINDNFFPSGGGFSTDDLNGSETVAQVALLILLRRQGAVARVA